MALLALFSAPLWVQGSPHTIEKKIGGRPRVFHPQAPAQNWANLMGFTRIEQSNGCTVAAPETQMFVYKTRLPNSSANENCYQQMMNSKGTPKQYKRQPHSLAQHNTPQHIALHHSKTHITQHCIRKRSIAQHSRAQHSTALQSTTQHGRA